MIIDTPHNLPLDINSLMQQLSDTQKDELLNALQKDKKKRENKEESKQFLEESLQGKTYKEVKDYLHKKYVEIEDNQEMFGYKGRTIEINLPEVANRHEGIKLKWFMSYDSFSKQEFEANPKFEENSYSEKEIKNILYGIDEYYKAANPQKTYPLGCFYGLVGKGFETGIIGHDSHFTLWLKGKDPLVRHTGYGSINNDHNSGRSHLLLKISG